MKHRAHLAELAALEALDKLALVEVIADLAVDEVVEFVGARQVVDGDDIVFAALVQALDEVAADEAGSAGNDDGHGRVGSAEPGGSAAITPACRTIQDR